MADFDPAPSGDTERREREAWIETTDTRQRVREVVSGLRDPTPVREIADRAACSGNSARKHLADLADLGVVREVNDDQGARYCRNDEFFRWRRANELAREHSVDTLVERLADLETEAERYREEYDVATPDEIAVEDAPDHASAHDRWRDATDWASVRRDVGVHRDAIRIARRQNESKLHA